MREQPGKTRSARSRRASRKEARRKEKQNRLLEIKATKEAQVYEEELRAVARPNTEKSISSINGSTDMQWLRGFRDRMKPVGEDEIVGAIDKRLKELEEINFQNQIPTKNVELSLVDRVQNSLRVYELLRTRERRRTYRANRTRQMIERLGEKETVTRIVTNLKTSIALETFTRYDRLDLSYEQIILDFPTEFDAALRTKARANLADASRRGEQITIF